MMGEEHKPKRRIESHMVTAQTIEHALQPSMLSVFFAVSHYDIKSLVWRERLNVHSRYLIRLLQVGAHVLSKINANFGSTDGSYTTRPDDFAPRILSFFFFLFSSGGRVELTKQ